MDEKIQKDANPEEKYLSAKKFIDQAKQDPRLSAILFELDCEYEKKKTTIVDEYLRHLYSQYIRYIIEKEINNKTIVSFLKNASRELLEDLAPYMIRDSYYYYLSYVLKNDFSMFLYVFTVTSGQLFCPDVTQELIKDMPKYISEIKHNLLVSSIIMICSNFRKEEKFRLFDEIMIIGADHWRLGDFADAFASIHFNFDDTKEYITKNYLSKIKL